jgi:hypothetical protein
MAYKNLNFPHDLGGNGPFDTVELTVTAGVAPTTTPMKAAADLGAYNDEDTDDQTRHQRFSELVQYFQQYGQTVSVASSGDNVVTLKYEVQEMFDDNSEGKAPWDTSADRPNAYDLATAFVAATAWCSGITVKVNGVTQNS